jgi:hypothetical protein
MLPNRRGHARTSGAAHQETRPRPPRGVTRASRTRWASSVPYCCPATIRRILPCVSVWVATPQCRECTIKHNAGHLGGKINLPHDAGLPQARTLRVFSRLMGTGNLGRHGHHSSPLVGLSTMECFARSRRSSRMFKRSPLPRSFSPLLQCCGLPEWELRDWTHIVSPAPQGQRGCAASLRRAGHVALVTPVSGHGSTSILRLISRAAHAWTRLAVTTGS